MRRSENRTNDVVGGFISWIFVVIIGAFVVYTIYNQVVGWEFDTTVVRSDFDAASASESLESYDGIFTATDTAPKYRYVNVNLLNIRDGIGTESTNIITVLPFATKIEYLGLTDDPDWAIIKYDGITAYAASKYLSKEMPNRYEIGEYNLITYDYKNDSEIRLHKLSYGNFIIANTGDFLVGDHLYIDGLGHFTVRFTRDIGEGNLALIFSNPDKESKFEQHIDTVWRMKYNPAV